MLYDDRLHPVQSLQLLLLLIAGCTVGPDYQPPQVNVAGSYFCGASGGKTRHGSNVAPLSDF